MGVVGGAGQDLTAPGVTRRAAVLGHPVAHSLSPALHRAAYAQLGLDGWAYGLQDVTAEELPGVVARLDGTWAGLSLTMPLKHAVMGLLDAVDPLAEVTGAVNTVVVQPGPGGAAGPLTGFNTDVHGIVAAVREAAAPGWVPRRAVILGAGATSSSAQAAVAELGLTRSTLVARRVPPAAAAATARMGVAVEHVAWTSPAVAAEAAAGADLVISTVPAGAADDTAAELARLGVLAGAVLLDVVYDPSPTPLAAAWEGAGGVVVPGWAMLLHQAEAQVRLMTGRTPDVEVMRVALLAELARRRGGGQVGASPPPFPSA